MERQCGQVSAKGSTMHTGFNSDMPGKRHESLHCNVLYAAMGNSGAAAEAV